MTISQFEIDLGKGLDIIGDIHGCLDEFLELLKRLGYQKSKDGLFRHPQGRKILSLGDIMSRGPRSLDTMLLFEAHIHAGLAYMIDSNHGWKIARWLDGRPVTLAHGDEMVEKEFNEYANTHGKDKTRSLKMRMKSMLMNAPSHYVIVENKKHIAVAVHAGIKDHYIGQDSPKIRDYCRYGPVVGIQANGKPKRGDWTVQHHSEPLVIWGHDPRPVSTMIQNTINIDQGAVFGGELTAYRLPEREVVQVSSQDYAQAAINPLEEWKEKRLRPPHLERFIRGYQVDTEFGVVHIPADRVKNLVDHFTRNTVPIEQLVYLPKVKGQVTALLFASTEAAEKWTGYPDLVVAWDETGRPQDLYQQSHEKKSIWEKVSRSNKGIDWLLVSFKDGKMELLADEHEVLYKVDATSSPEEWLAHEALTRFVKGESVERIHECVMGILSLRVEV